MRVELGRFVGWCLAAALIPALSWSCASSEEDPIFGSNSVKSDSGVDSSAGASGGTDGVGPGGAPGTGGGGAVPSTGGTGPMGTGGTGGPGGSGTGGTQGTGTEGSAGTGTEGSAGTGTAGTGSTCNPQFCPQTGTGSPCCMADSRCGIDTGMGCQQTD